MATKKFTKGIMCFGAIGIGFKSRLVICRGTVDSEAYIHNLLESGVVHEMNRLHGEFRWLLMQDGAASHTSRQTMDWLHQHVNVFAGWPPNSPDLNPIEMLWAILKRERHRIEGATLEQQVCAAWDSITEATINRLVDRYVNETCVGSIFCRSMTLAPGQRRRCAGIILLNRPRRNAAIKIRISVSEARRVLTWRGSVSGLAPGRARKQAGSRTQNDASKLKIEVS